MAAAERPKHAVMQSSLILAVPNEIIFKILAKLSPPNLRSIRNTNKRLRVLAEDKLRRDNGAPFPLSSALILKIAQHLSARDCSRLARVSHKYYSLITKKILRQNVEKGGSSLLYFAAKNNSTRMARRLLEYGADINARCGLSSGNVDKKMNPLLFAAHHGHLDIVNLFLEFGALHYLTEQCAPLMAAISRQHDQVALALAEALQSVGAEMYRIMHTPLQMACKKKMVQLVKQLLKYKTPSKADRVQNLNHALYYVVVRERNSGMFLKRELHQDDYEMVLMLLEHGANPDAQLHGVGSRDRDTARIVSSRHPDPRVRALLMKPALPEDRAKPEMQVGRFWTQPSQAGSPLFQDNYAVRKYSEEIFPVRPGDIVRQSAAEQATETSSNEHPTRMETVYGSTHNTRPSRTASFSSFPPLGAPKATPQHVNKSSQSIVPTVTGTNDTTCVYSLGGKSSASLGNAGVTTWAEVCEGKYLRKVTASRETSTPEKGMNSGQETGGKGQRKRKTKWTPLQL
jgi:ankyrin repeat protein